MYLDTRACTRIVDISKAYHFSSVKPITLSFVTFCTRTEPTGHSGRRSRMDLLLGRNNALSIQYLHSIQEKSGKCYRIFKSNFCHDASTWEACAAISELPLDHMELTELFLLVCGLQILCFLSLRALTSTQILQFREIELSSDQNLSMEH